MSDTLNRRYDKAAKWTGTLNVTWLAVDAADAAVDYEAALNVLINEDANMARGFGMSTVRRAVDAALGRQQ